jgi:hypothetical protein
LKKQLRDEWVKALRSGEYEQGRHRLQSEGNRFCCLGVLCLVAEQIGFVTPVRDSIEGSPLKGASLTFQPDGLIDQVRNVESDVMCANDSGQTFVQIADWIEVNVPVES